MTQQWPIAELDPVRRLRIMATAVHGTFADAFTEHRPEDVWAVVSDFERELPRLLPDFRTARVHGECAAGPADAHLEVLAVGYLGQRARFDVDLGPGWCWMQSRFLLCGFAVSVEGDRTRYAFLGGVRPSGAVPVARMLRSPGQAYARMVTRRIERRVGDRTRNRAQPAAQFPPRMEPMA